MIALSVMIFVISLVLAMVLLRRHRILIRLAVGCAVSLVLILVAICFLQSTIDGPQGEYEVYRPENH
jgi:hypothetical protein